MMRSHYCGQLNESLDGQEITLCGWVHRRRDHGGVIFLDIRDREGLAQVVFDPDRAETFAKADRVRSEYVVKLTGKVRLRPEGARNANMASGAIEVLGYELEVLNEAETPPFPLNEYTDVGEETRLRYRFIDLRRPEMAEKLKLRSRITSSIRRYLDENGFLDVETPILTRATPEGARDYLVPSRTHPGSFFALPQSPQLFKQLLMVAGFDRYYQIAKCFRDEDLRADRQPEFTQIDIETSFLDEKDIMDITETMVRNLFKEVLDVEFGELPHMTLAEAMRRFGSDKPDLRIPLELVDVEDQLKDVDFKVLRRSGQRSQVPRRRPARTGRGEHAAQADRRLHQVRRHLRRQGPGLHQGQRARRRRRGPAVAHRQEHPAGQHQRHPRPRRRGGWRHRVLWRGQDQDRFRGSGRAAHQARSRPQPADLPVGAAVGGRLPDVRGERRWQPDRHAPPLHLAQVQPARAQGQSGCGAVACLRHGAQRHRAGRRFHSYPRQEDAAGGLRGAGDQRSGTGREVRLPAGRPEVRRPAHGGLAFGLDRLVMLMTGASSIREVIAFPKTQSAADVMTQAPGAVDAKALRELHIRLREQPKAE
ncbi:hypothetical protein LUZ63_023868 [Rhynchospora breviuscula]|uniref:Aminoacyl-transfer RNA synthetases class-II family profile domain-containing protein n=2 Tax=cellular organisms TaxID=131567 RepID=A0A9P9Z2Q3_9POAL|nr:hypothetical protein LUZ63_023868 [Rhynchospora breviuscula]